MAAKKPTKSRTSAVSKKKGFVFKWWMALIGVVVVAGVGLAVLRFSRAGVFDIVNAPILQEYANNCNNNFGGPNTVVGGSQFAAVPCVKYAEYFLQAFENINNPGLFADGNFDQTDKDRTIAFQSAVNYVLSTNTAVRNAAQSAGLPTSLVADGIIGPSTWKWINTSAFFLIICVQENCS